MPGFIPLAKDTKQDEVPEADEGSGLGLEPWKHPRLALFWVNIVAAAPPYWFLLSATPR